VIEWQIVKMGACRSYAEVPEGAKIVAVNGADAWGRCEACGRAIIAHQRYAVCLDGELVHDECKSALKEER